MLFEISISATLYSIDTAVFPEAAESAEKFFSLSTFLSDCLHRAVREQHEVAYKYRSWKARVYDAMLRSDSKTAEWKASTVAESRNEFVQHKADQARCVANVVLLRSLLDSLRAVRGLAALPVPQPD